MIIHAITEYDIQLSGFLN